MIQIHIIGIGISYIRIADYWSNPRPQVLQAERTGPTRVHALPSDIAGSPKVPLSGVFFSLLLNCLPFSQKGFLKW